MRREAKRLLEWLRAEIQQAADSGMDAILLYCPGGEYAIRMLTQEAIDWASKNFLQTKREANGQVLIFTMNGLFDRDVADEIDAVLSLFKDHGLQVQCGFQVQKA